MASGKYKLKIPSPSAKTTGEIFKNLRKTINAGSYREPGLVSVGGHIGPVGAVLGASKGKPFGSINVKGKKVAGFGPDHDY